MSRRSDITVKLAGESGEGVISAGDILTSGAARSGYWVLTFRTYPAEIRGGPCMYQVRIGSERVHSRGRDVDLLLCFNQEAFDLQHDTLGDGGLLLYEADSVKVTEEFESRSRPIPLGELAKQASGSRRGKNMVAVGTVCGLLDSPTEQIEELIVRRYAHKGDVGEANIKALKAGVEFATEELSDAHRMKAPEAAKADRILLSGNQAICLGSLAAGANYFAGYPITPASDILEWLSSRLPRFGGVTVQTEDEIAALASVLGASFAGNKAMTATSGPGLSLMSELVGLAGMAEIPAVIVDAQRAGPSTGLPTKTEQSDLNHALYGGHGEAPRVVMAPTSVEDCFHVMVDAFNAAETYQVPVIVLSDQSLSHRLETVPRPNVGAIEVEERLRPDEADANGAYERYRITDSGISSMSVPGEAGAYVSTGIEHDTTGHPHYEPELHEAMQKKRFEKLEPLAKRTDRIVRWGPDQADVGILGWGSTAGAAQESAELGGERGIAVSGFYPRILQPLPVEAIKEWAETVDHIVVPEVNFTGQFARLVRSDCGIEVESLTNVSGLPFTAEDIFESIVRAMNQEEAPVA